MATGSSSDAEIRQYGIEITISGPPGTDTDPESYCIHVKHRLGRGDGNYPNMFLHSCCHSLYVVYADEWDDTDHPVYGSLSDLPYTRQAITTDILCDRCLVTANRPRNMQREQDENGAKALLEYCRGDRPRPRRDSFLRNPFNNQFVNLQRLHPYLNFGRDEILERDRALILGCYENNTDEANYAFQQMLDRQTDIDRTGRDIKDEDRQFAVNRLYWSLPRRVPRVIDSPAADVGEPSAPLQDCYIFQDISDASLLWLIRTEAPFLDSFNYNGLPESQLRRIIALLLFPASTANLDEMGEPMRTSQVHAQEETGEPHLPLPTFTSLDYIVAPSPNPEDLEVPSIRILDFKELDAAPIPASNLEDLKELAISIPDPAGLQEVANPLQSPQDLESSTLRPLMSLDEWISELGWSHDGAGPFADESFYYNVTYWLEYLRDLSRRDVGLDSNSEMSKEEIDKYVISTFIFIAEQYCTAIEDTDYAQFDFLPMLDDGTQSFQQWLIFNEDSIMTSPLKDKCCFRSALYTKYDQYLRAFGTRDDVQAFRASRADRVALFRSLMSQVPGVLTRMHVGPVPDYGNLGVDQRELYLLFQSNWKQIVAEDENIAASIRIIEAMDQSDSWVTNHVDEDEWLDYSSESDIDSD